MKTFTTAARRVAKKTVDFELDGDTYHFTPPKTTGIYLAGIEGSGTDQLKAQLDWLEAGLPADEASHLRERLLDVTDDLEITGILEVVGWLLEEMTGRPTTPSPE